MIIIPNEDGSFSSYSSVWKILSDECLPSVRPSVVTVLSRAFVWRSLLTVLRENQSRRLCIKRERAGARLRLRRRNRYSSSTPQRLLIAETN